MSEIVLSLFRGEIVKPQSITMKAIAEAVAARHGVSPEDFRIVTRRRQISHARQEAMWRMRQVRRPDGIHRYSFPMISRFFGMSSHQSVIFGVRAYERRASEAQGEAA